MAARACQFGFDRTNYFFLKYLKFQDEHYNRDIIPIFEAWHYLTIEPLDINAPIKGKEFENLIITTAERLIQLDRRSMGRCHLNSYHYADDRNIDVIIRYISKYNQKVRAFIDDFDTRVKKEIPMRVPSLEEYRRKLGVNYYHYDNISYYFWHKMFDDKGKTQLTINSSPDDSLHELKKEPGGDRISIGNSKESIYALKNYLDEISGNTTKTLCGLREERERLATRFKTFTSAIDRILGDVSWNKSLKGWCGWEKGFFGFSTG